MEGQCTCDHQCIHWNACWEELRGGSKRVMPLMSDKVANGTARIYQKRKYTMA